MAIANRWAIVPVDPPGRQLLPDNVATPGGHVSRKCCADGDEAVRDEALHVGIREHAGG